ncbi:MAG TPA: malto-oligosyltrehalose synthase [Candidatus Methylacidiphilales bacterium]|nr:malto-oligosyltrehalose synthase [Candidatus Methylacidiphilales bacterium]
MNPPFRLPRATYRIQLHAGFDFNQLGQIVPYLDELGISDIYASPIFRAAPGSMHGYDICDHNEINVELGGIDGLMKVGDILRERNMGLLADFVPNHMGISIPSNWKWMDILEHGHLSRFASLFDIEWNPHQASLQDRIQVPMLHDFYGRVLEAGEIQLKYEKNAFWVYYRSLRFPLRPESYAAILQRLAWFKNPGTPLAQRLEQIAEQFRALPKPSTTESLEEAEKRNRQSHDLRHELAKLIETSNLAADLDLVLTALNGKPDDPASFDNLHQILEEQNYRLTFWKSGTHEINYRRFFAIDTLVGLHMEAREVFDDCHRLLKHLIGKGVITGLRIDHIDGLWDPAQYLERLCLLGRNGEQPIYVLVEKILSEGEQLPENWAVHGTTGYDFISGLINLLVESKNESSFTRFYREFAGMRLDPHEQAYQLKLFIMEELFSNVIDGLSRDLEAQVKSDRRWRDWTLNDLRLALARTIACLSVYRTYRRAGQDPDPSDVAAVMRASAEALRRNRSSDPIPFLFIRDLWIGRYPDARVAPELKKWADNWICKLQQFTGAIMAKSVEDTLFYRYVRLFATNEVGHHPTGFGRDISLFHQGNQTRLRQWPASMLATSTHDTKVSEDVRSRLLALSELPERWESSVRKWSANNRAFKTKVDNLLAPDANEEYLLYQILLGVWPIHAEDIDDVFRDRIKNYMRKALPESKANTNWANPNHPWLIACDDFIDAILDRRQAGPFWDDFLPFASDLAWRGMNFSLTQIALKLTSPGVPDLYQGTELWDFSLVDPDNRRPVDYTLRRHLLRSLDGMPVQNLYKSWEDGRIKMFLIHALLQHRRQHPQLFQQGSYIPVEVAGRHQNRFISFLRQDGPEQLLIVASTRLGETLDNPRKTDLGTWLTGLTPPSAWADLLSPRKITKQTPEIPLELLLNGLPLGIFRAEHSF